MPIVEHVLWRPVSLANPRKHTCPPKEGAHLGYLLRDKRASLRLFSTGRVSYTDGGAAATPTSRLAPPTLCFATPTLGRFGGFWLSGFSP